jgi:hypothetical protein
MMKHLRKYSALAFAAVLLLASCRDDDWSPYPDWNDNVGAATKIQVNASRNSFRLGQGIANEYLEFTLDVDGYEITEVKEVDLMLVFTEGSPAKPALPAVLLKKVSTFPSTVQVTAQEVADLIGGGWTINDFQAGDRFQLTFPIHTVDGRKLTVALASEVCVQPAQPMFGSCQVTVNVVN